MTSPSALLAGLLGYALDAGAALSAAAARHLYREKAPARGVRGCRCEPERSALEAWRVAGWCRAVPLPTCPARRE